MPVAAQYLNAVRGRWRLVAVVTVAGAALFGTLGWAQRPMYQAEMRLLVAFGDLVPAPTSSAQTAAQLGIEQALVESRVRTYAQVTSTTRVTGPVVAKLRLPYSAEDLASRVRASSPLHTTVIEVVVLDADPVQAMSICDAIAAAMLEMARQEDRSASIAAAPDILVVDRATVASESGRRWWGLHFVGGMVGGFAIGVGLASLLVEFRRNTNDARTNE
jgi:capsular polysaccharide biosynthesis protein